MRGRSNGRQDYVWIWSNGKMHVYEALDKLYYGRDLNTITVFSVVLNPSS